LNTEQNLLTTKCELRHVKLQVVLEILNF